MDVDPLASMRCWAIEVELGGRTYTVPALPAADWWPVLAANDQALILDMIVSTEDLDERLLTGEISRGELATALRDAIEEAAGRPAHAAFVLAVVAEMRWSEINGVLAQRGFRWDVMPLGAALDAIYVLIMGALGKEAQDKFQAVLEDESLTQAKGKRKPSQRVVEEFESMAGPRPTTGVKASAEPSDSGPPKTQTRSRPRRPAAVSRAPKQPPEPPG